MGQIEYNDNKDKQKKVIAHLDLSAMKPMIRFETC